MQFITEQLKKYTIKTDCSIFSIYNQKENSSVDSHREFYHSEYTPVIEYCDNKIHLTILNYYKIFDSIEEYIIFVNELNVKYNGIIIISDDNSNIKILKTLYSSFNHKEYDTYDRIIFYEDFRECNDYLLAEIVLNTKYVDILLRDGTYRIYNLYYTLNEYFGSIEDLQDFIIKTIPYFIYLNRDRKIKTLLNGNNI